ncbi:MAG: hypothetical protein AAF675_19135, partial [Pseudomonadota bacterium]
GGAILQANATVYGRRTMLTILANSFITAARAEEREMPPYTPTRRQRGRFGRGWFARLLGL